MKDVGMRVRVQRDLRDKFLAACRAQDVPAAQVIREFMCEYVETNMPSLVRKNKERGANPENAEE